MKHHPTNQRTTKRLDAPRRQGGFVSIADAVFGTTLVIVVFAILLATGAKTFLGYFGLPFSG